jgi:spermidine synthase
LEKFTKEFLFINQKIIYQKNSPYGNVILTENSGQINFYENGNFLFSMDTTGTGSGNIAENEEAVHFAMLQSKHPDRVLLVSGGIEGQLKEILKYPVKQIDYSEINPALIGAAKRFKLLPQSDKINYINTDVRLFLSHNKTKYDVILLNIPPPLTAETNRYYTLEFFRLLKQHLNPKGIIKTQLPSSGNYLSKDAEKSYSVLYATLSAAFEQVNIIPGEKDYFLASDKAIDLNIVAEITERKIESEYVKYYLDDFSIAQRSEIIRKRINPHADINYDFKPVAYPVQIKAQLARFKTNYWILAVFILLFLIFVLRNTKRQNFGMFAVGFASITAELLIIFAFQILYGNVFSLLSVIIMIFMVGLAVGSLYLPKLFNKNLLKQYKTAFILLSLILLVLPVLFLYLFSAIHSVVLNYVLIFLLSLCISTISGYLFYISEQISSGNKNQVAGKIYSADLFGSATGALAVSMFIVPFAGFIFTGIIAGVLSFTAFLVMKNKG